MEVSVDRLVRLEKAIRQTDDYQQYLRLQREADRVKAALAAIEAIP